MERNNPLITSSFLLLLLLMLCRFTGSHSGGLCTGTYSHCLFNMLSIEANKVNKGPQQQQQQETNQQLCLLKSWSVHNNCWLCLFNCMISIPKTLMTSICLEIWSWKSRTILCFSWHFRGWDININELDNCRGYFKRMVNLNWTVHLGFTKGMMDFTGVVPSLVGSFGNVDSLVVLLVTHDGVMFKSWIHFV